VDDVTDITQRVGDMNPYQRGLIVRHITHGESQVSTTLNVVVERVQGEFTVLSLHLIGLRGRDSALMRNAIVDEVHNRTDFQVVLVCELLQVRTPRHAAVLIHDLDDGGRRSTPRQTCQVTPGVGMARTLQYATRLCHDWEHV